MRCLQWRSSILDSKSKPISFRLIWYLVIFLSIIVHDLYALIFSVTILFPLGTGQGTQVPSVPSLLYKRSMMCWLENFCLFFQQWYNSSMNVICTWLTDRMDLQLHIYQLKTLIRMVKVKEKIIILLCKQLTGIHFIGKLKNLLNTKNMSLHLKQGDCHNSISCKKNV